MGCFLACFGGPKDRKRRKAVRRIPSRERVKVRKSYDSGQLPQHLGISPPLKTSPQPQPLLAKPPAPDPILQQRSLDSSSSPISRCAVEGLKPTLKQLPEGKSASPPVESRREEGDKSTFSSPKKKVTFDLNVTTYDHIPAADDGEVDSSLEVRKEENDANEGGALSPPTAPANHRYQNCVSDDDDDYGYDDDDEDEEDDQEEDDEPGENEEEESYDSYFSIQMDKERQHSINEVSSAAKSPAPPAAASQTSATRQRSQYVHSVLNPVENLSQWKSVAGKAGPQPPKNPRKENISQEERGSELGKKNQKISVDTSLSNWLPSLDNQENSPCRSNSSAAREERPILGALTVEDLKKSPASSPSPRKSPSRSPDEVPILGTVGGYWSSGGDPEKDSSGDGLKGIPNTTSKYREDRRVNWHSTPFEVRLERTLNRGDAEAY